MIDNATDLAAQQLEDLLNEECKCESIHQAKGNETCSEKVTHRLTVDCWKDSHQVCWNQFRYTSSNLKFGCLCLFCHRPATDCWSIRPV